MSGFDHFRSFRLNCSCCCTFLVAFMMAPTIRPFRECTKDCAWSKVTWRHGHLRPSDGYLGVLRNRTMESSTYAEYDEQLPTRDGHPCPGASGRTLPRLVDRLARLGIAAI